MTFKDAAQAMNRLYERQKDYVPRDNEPELFANLFSDENPLSGKTLADLEKAFANVLRKAKERGQLLLEIPREQVTLSDCLEELFSLLSTHPQGVLFADIFEDCRSRMQFIVTFLALLELVRQGVALVTQNETYGDIYIHPGDLKKYVRE